MTEITIIPDIPLEELQRLRALKPIVEKIVKAAAHRYVGQDLLLHIYAAGLSHGMELVAGERSRPPLVSGKISGKSKKGTGA